MPGLPRRSCRPRGQLVAAAMPAHVALTRRPLQEYALEGSFRSVHARLRTHAESVAFFGGGAAEGATVDAHLRRLLHHCQRTVRIRWACPHPCILP